MNTQQLHAIGTPAEPAAQVRLLAAIALAAGVPGLVCSPLEVAFIRSEHGDGPLLVVPGIRPAGSAAGDQQRYAGPAEAILAGASMLVVGRPITQAPDPAAAANAILEQIASAL
jgi:orotidine-5'-phosphate decarboxylase